MSSGLQCRRGSARCHPDTKMIVIDWEGKHPRFAPLRWKVARLPFSQSRSTTACFSASFIPLVERIGADARLVGRREKCHNPNFRNKFSHITDDHEI